MSFLIKDIYISVAAMWIADIYNWIMMIIIPVQYSLHSPQFKISTLSLFTYGFAHDLLWPPGGCLFGWLAARWQPVSFKAWLKMAYIFLTRRRLVRKSVFIRVFSRTRSVFKLKFAENVFQMFGLTGWHITKQPWECHRIFCCMLRLTHFCTPTTHRPHREDISMRREVESME